MRFRRGDEFDGLTDKDRERIAALGRMEAGGIVPKPPKSRQVEIPAGTEIKPIRTTDVLPVPKRGKRT